MTVNINETIVMIFYLVFLFLQVGKATGKLRHFIIEPFVAHRDVSLRDYYFMPETT